MMAMNTRATTNAVLERIYAESVAEFDQADEFWRRVKNLTDEPGQVLPVVFTYNGGWPLRTALDFMGAEFDRIEFDWPVSA